MTYKKVIIIFHLLNENVEIKDDYIALSSTIERYLNECNNGCNFIKCQNCIIPKSSINYIEFLEEESEEENNG